MNFLFNLFFYKANELDDENSLKSIERSKKNIQTHSILKKFKLKNLSRKER